MQAAILSIGDELVLGQTVDTNSAWLAEQLVQRGLPTLYHHTVADDRAAVAWAIGEAAERCDVVLITGGLGPTEDDLTREALADAMGVELITDAAAVAQLEAFFAARGRTMPDRNRVQAQHPRGTTMIPNANGTAPGIRATLHKATLYVMPGVPREMKAMFATSVLPELDATPSRGVILATKVNTFGLGESDLAERLGDLMARDRNPRVGTTVAGGICSVRIRSEFPDMASAQQQLDQTLARVHERVGPTAFGRDDTTLQEAAMAVLVERKLTVATAESCTGGLLGAMLTEVPGSSSIYRGGWITYCNSMKQSLLNVPPAMLETHGAVSPQVAAAMAHGALRNADADIAIALTGIAGPDGGTPEKPVGTVWIGRAWREGHDTRTDALLLRSPGSRQAIRDRAAKTALQLLRFHALGVNSAEIQWFSAAANTQPVPAR